VHYLNIFGFAASQEVIEEYDLAIVTYEVLALRQWVYWKDIRRRLERLLTNSKRKVLLPQDDFTFSSRLDSLAIAAQVDSIWSPLSKDLDLLYPMSKKRGTRFELALTGYMEIDQISEYNSYVKEFREKRIDLGQRVSKLPASFGAMAQRKAYIAEVFAEEFLRRGYLVDVSTLSTDSFVGKGWLTFLGNTKFTISRKGGASLGDTTNSMADSISMLRLLFPFLSDGWVTKLASKRNVVEGEFDAISPRLFEAAALGVCQILEEDEYLEGEMVAWEHYIPFSSDFSNLDEVFAFVEDDQAVQKMICDAKELLIESGRYSYESFVQRLISSEIDDKSRLTEEPVKIVDLDFITEPSSVRTLVALQALPILNIFSEIFKKTYRAQLKAISRLERIPETLVLPWRGIYGSGFEQNP